MRKLIIIPLLLFFACNQKVSSVLHETITFGESSIENFPEGDSILIDSNFSRLHIIEHIPIEYDSNYNYEHDSISGQIIFHPPLTDSLWHNTHFNIESFSLPPPSDTDILMLGGIRPTESILITISGESNAPGYGQNYFLSTAEKAWRFTKIWNPNVSDMKHLDLPTNQLATFDTTHGFEVEFANLTDSAAFGQQNVYITKAGVGSTRAYQWMPGGILYNNMIARIDASLIKVNREHGVVPTMWLLWTQGINDMFDGNPTAVWKDSTKAIFNDLHFLYPSLKIIITKFNQPAYTTYNTVIQEIDDELDYVWSVDATGAGLRADDTHWDYQGLKLIGRRAVEIIQAND